MSGRPGSIALCVPAFNAEAFLGRLLRGARAQTVPFDEIWVYDDASTDATGRVAEELGARVIRGDANRGCSAGKNTLAAACSSEWIHFHDADDALEPTFVEAARRWTTAENGPDIVFFNYKSLSYETNMLLGIREFDGDALRQDPLGYCLSEQINPFCGVYRRDSFLKAGGWDEDKRVLQSEDQAGHLRFALAGLRFDADPASTVINYIREGSMTTANLPGAQRSTYQVLRKAAESTPARYHEIIAERLWATAGLSAAYNDWTNADRAALLALSISPHGPKAGATWFRLMTPRMPRASLRIREKLIRIFRASSRRLPVYHRIPAPLDDN